MVDSIKRKIKHTKIFWDYLKQLIPERQVGTSKGILTDIETAYTATATAVKRANSDTMALIDKIHNAIDIGNEMTLKADGVFLNISPDL